MSLIFLLNCCSSLITIRFSYISEMISPKLFRKITYFVILEKISLICSFRIAFFKVSFFKQIWNKSICIGVAFLVKMSTVID